MVMKEKVDKRRMIEWEIYEGEMNGVKGIVRKEKREWLIFKW